MKYVELNLFPEEEEETQKSSDSKWNKKYNSDKGKEYNSDKGNEYSSDESNKYDFTVFVFITIEQPKLIRNIRV